MRWSLLVVAVAEKEGAGTMAKFGCGGRMLLLLLSSAVLRYYCPGVRRNVEV